MQFTLPVNALGFTMTESGPLESIGLLIFTSLEQKMNTATFVKFTVKFEGNINLIFFLIHAVQGIFLFLKHTVQGIFYSKFTLLPIAEFIPH